MFKAVLFDLDGTLVDSLPIWHESLRLTLRGYGINLEGKEIVKKAMGKKPPAICKSVGITSSPAEFDDKLNANLLLISESAALFPQVIETLDKFKAEGIEMCLISYTDRWLVDRFVKITKIRGYFKAILAYEDVKNPKPDPEAVFAVCKKIGIDPKDAVVVGDTEKDIGMGKAAGCATVLFLPEGNKRFYDFVSLKNEVKPDFSMTNFGELEKIVAGRS
jgi:HAD superfamily hydrolase (TIGR01509 family)